MLKLLIVEDEKWEREGLMDFLDWGSLGIDLSGAACDGFEGIEKARILRPDIIITDIKMPGMDGLKMSRSIREFIPDAKIIILTGYDDFKLAREAINMNANAYILKPVEEEELMDALKKVADECMGDAKMQKEQRMLKELVDESYIAARRELLLELLSDEAGEDTVRQASSLGILPSAGNYSVIAVGAFNDSTVSPAAEQAGQAALAVDLEGADTELRSKLVKVGINFATAISENERTFFVLAVHRDMPADALHLAAEAISCYFAERGIPVVTGIGTPMEGTGKLYRTSRQAREALDFALFWRKSPFVDYSELSALQQDNAAKTGEFLVKGNDLTKQLMNSLRAADAERTDSLLDDIFRLIEYSKWLDRSMVANLLCGLLNETSLLFRTATLQNREEEAAGAALLNQTDYISMKEKVYGFFGKENRGRTGNDTNYMGGI